MTGVYGFKKIVPQNLGDAWLCGAEDALQFTGVSEVFIGTAARCDYCALPPGNGAHKCLNCGAPK